ncbi:MAG: aminopeptidase N [Proteobacteria bacterium]|nr:aminopeptidase N [Pseudomonadota bacterium]
MPPQATRLADYRAPDWLIDGVALEFDLAPSATRVKARIDFRRNPERAAEGPADLALDGRLLTLVSAVLDGCPVEPELTAEGLRLAAASLPAERFTWECETEIVPRANTTLEGLYISQGMYCTQCEAEGFRKITFYPDRPDVMAPFRVRIEADRATCPVLLSNGNPVASGDLPKGRHFAEWRDPHPKPAYLFALVAGDLVSHDAGFTTMSGREVALKIYVRPGDQGKCAYAMDSLKRAMRWDEATHGREYDLDLFMIVAVDDFNMGAMENKGLNIFNSKYVLASPETATDRDYALIEAIVAHEYFHNWTGNRITCRDWFQLCLKEGLTVFRDQQFSADTRGRAVTRIDDVKRLRARQFGEDQGPLAHPVRPREYIEINNFYTATVYEKGAEVIGMLRTLVGSEGYRRALELYFERHDGQACTIEQFRKCFEDATGRDLAQFARWWSQAGTPRIAVEEAWADGRYTLTLRQSTPPTPGQADKQPLVIPVAVGLIGPNGAEIAPTQVLELTTAEQSFSYDFGDPDPGWRPLPRLGSGRGAESDAAPTPGKPILSILRGFSAPVIVEREISDAEAAFLLAHDTDPFNRWEAGRAYAVRIALGLIARTGPLTGDIPGAWVEGMGAVLTDDSLDAAFRAMVLEVPGVDEISREIAARGGLADPDAIHAALRRMRQTLGNELSTDLTRIYESAKSDRPYSPDAASAGPRALKNRCLALLAATGSEQAFALAEAQFRAAGNMSDALPALTALAHEGAPVADGLLEAFHSRWQHDPLVVDKWLALQASAPLPGTLARVEALTGHASFDWRNPNKFRALIGVLAGANPVVFHRADGAGYRFVADWLIRLDAVNPQTTARVAGVFETMRGYDTGRQTLMRAELDRIAGVANLSKNTGEIVERILAG